MKLIYDYDTLVETTPEWEAALKVLMQEEIKMMKSARPEYADCWEWAECTIYDLGKHCSIGFTFGGKEDRPDGSPPDFKITVAPYDKTRIEHGR